MNTELTGADIDTLHKLAMAYPHGVDAGDVPSKSGRDSLIGRGWADYHEDGVTYLNREGFEVYRARMVGR